MCIDLKAQYLQIGKESLSKSTSKTPIEQCSENVTLKGAESVVNDSPDSLHVPGRLGALDPTRGA